MNRQPDVLVLKPEHVELMAWIIDRHRQQIRMLVLEKAIYVERVYRGTESIRSSAFPTLMLSASQVLAGGI